MLPILASSSLTSTPPLPAVAQPTLRQLLMMLIAAGGLVVDALAPPILLLVPINLLGVSRTTMVRLSTLLIWLTTSTLPTSSQRSLLWVRGARNTFLHVLSHSLFCLHRVISFPAMLQSQYMGQHQISVHTWSHTALTTQTNEEIIAELGWSKQVIKDTLGVTPNTMRPPYGDIE
jgi:hypothetical protein